jgi:hypothetical protein
MIACRVKKLCRLLVLNGTGIGLATYIIYG